MLQHWYVQCSENGNEFREQNYDSCLKYTVISSQISREINLITTIATLCVVLFLSCFEKL